MSLNCRPGDLAVIVNSDFQEAIGKLCLVLRYSDIDADIGWCWACRVNSAVPWEHSDTGDVVRSRSGMIPDAWLRPIRDQPGADETLTWKPVPQPVPEKEQA